MKKALSFLLALFGTVLASAQESYVDKVNPFIIGKTKCV